MNDFDYDVLQKKRVAYGAKHKVRAKRGCHLPSDNLTAAQKRRLNGEMKIYNMNAPMSWADFKEMPDDLKVQYINHLSDEYQVSQYMLADMFGVNQTFVSRQFRIFNIPMKNVNRRVSNAATAARDAKWAEFLNTGVAPTEDSDTTSAVETDGMEDFDTIEKLPVEQETPIEKSEPLKPLMKCLSMEFEDVHNWLDLYSRVMDFPTAPGAKVKITLEW